MAPGFPGAIFSLGKSIALLLRFPKASPLVLLSSLTLQNIMLTRKLDDFSSQLKFQKP